MTIQRPLSDAELSQITKGDVLSNDLFHFSLQQRSLVGTGENTPPTDWKVSKAGSQVDKWTDDPMKEAKEARDEGRDDELGQEEGPRWEALEEDAAEQGLLQQAEINLHEDAQGSTAHHTRGPHKHGGDTGSFKHEHGSGFPHELGPSGQHLHPGDMQNNEEETARYGSWPESWKDDERQARSARGQDSAENDEEREADQENDPAWLRAHGFQGGPHPGQHERQPQAPDAPRMRPQEFSERFPRKAQVSKDHKSFKERENEFSHEKGVTDPAGLAAYVGRKKYGKKGMAKRSAEGRHSSKAQPSDNVSSGKAKKILEDNSVRGHPLTEKQKGMFGAAAGRASKAMVAKAVRQVLREEGLL